MCNQRGLIKLEDNALLLGADLEGSAGQGWEEVVERFKGRLANASFVKIPHHGGSSQGAYNQKIWSELLPPKPVAVLTAYNRGTNPPPAATDLVRIKELAGNAYFTGKKPATTIRPPKNQTPPEVVLKQAPYYSIGRVTCRRKKGTSPTAWTVTLDGRASKLN